MDNFLTVPEAGRLLGLHWRTAYREIKRGRLRAIKVGAQRLIIARQEVEKILEARRQEEAKHDEE